jgi:hypothetical protein
METAKGRRVSIREVYLKQKPSDWTLPYCTALIRTCLRDLNESPMMLDAKLQCLLTSTSPSVSVLDKPSFEDFNKFFLHFYMQLKSHSFVPFLFATGSSRLALNNFFVNDLRDWSYDIMTRTALDTRGRRLRSFIGSSCRCWKSCIEYRDRISRRTWNHGTTNFGGVVISMSVCSIR